MKIQAFKSLVIFTIVLTVLVSCVSKQEISVLKYYEYDRQLPLADSVILLSDSLDYSLSSVEFTSVHNKRVTGLLSVPSSSEPSPVVILLHGVGDRKTVDYIEAGHDYFIKADMQF